MVYEKLGKVADILYWIISGVFILCEGVFIIKYFDGIINTDQLLLYTVCIVSVIQILHRGQKDRKKNGNDGVVKNDE